MASQADKRTGLRGEQDAGQALVKAGIALGLGFGGFFDGIVFHQLLQWHHMVTSAGYPPTSLRNLQINTLADGLFHSVTWIITLIGVFMLWRATRSGAPLNLVVLIGAMILGFGLFNVVEGLIDHFILGIHHVREDVSPEAQRIYDIAFLAWGAAMMAIGWLLIRRSWPADRG